MINELNATVTAFSYDAKNGVLQEQRTISTLPADFTGRNACAEVQVSSSGKFLYASNRGHDTLAVFAVDAEGNLSLVQRQPTQGKEPRHFTLDPTGHWLLAENQNSDSIAVFSVDAQTGQLNPTGQMVTVGAPVCMTFVTAR